MRRFLVVGHTQTTGPDVPLADLPGRGGRLDVLARAVTSALCLSHGLRRDTEIWTVIDHAGVENGPRTVVWHGGHLRHLNPDERSTAALFAKAFAHDAIEHLEPVHAGIEVAAWGLGAALDAFAANGPLVWLDRTGADIRSVGADVLAGGHVLSDHLPWADAERALIERHPHHVVSLGPHWLHGHQAITLVHDECDRRSGPVPSSKQD